ncbi:hypothetical protein CLCR_02584 [Cladophialophora carrionii]|uniref:Uncharacterized protein n=1 Tax=Cladophialophora carrionii TaxID=86049 RepID=A0A1C1CF18_9EURO|nr:hypothetical protein CLCR_02584 [Cladophialophora carrionii]
MAHSKQLSATLIVGELSVSPSRELAPLQRKELVPGIQSSSFRLDSAGRPFIGEETMPGQPRATRKNRQRRRIVKQVGNNTTGANVLFGGNQEFNNASPRYAARDPVSRPARRASQKHDSRQDKNRQEQGGGGEQMRKNSVGNDSAIGDIGHDDDENHHSTDTGTDDGADDGVDGGVGDDSDGGSDDGSDDKEADLFTQKGNNSKGANVLYGGNQKYNGSEPVVFYS